MYNKIYHYTLITLSILCFSVLSFIYFPESIDDAYIGLRYSHNLITGNGLAFNPNEHIEGFSTFSWVVLIAFFGSIGLPMPLMMKIISYLYGIISIFYIYKSSKKIFENTYISIFSVFLFSTSSFIVLWSVDGLETMFYTMLLSILMYLMISKEKNIITLGTVSSIISLTRPEGIMYSLFTIINAIYEKNIKKTISLLIMISGTFGAYLIFRLMYYGQFIANTASHKLNPGIISIKNGLNYLYNFNADSGFIILPLALLGFLLNKNKNHKLIIPLIFILLQTLFLMVSGGDFMYGYRFIVPMIPALIILISSFIAILSKKIPKQALFIISAIIILIISIFQYTALPTKTIRLDNLTYRQDEHFLIAEYLNKDLHVQKNDTVLLSEAGIIPYYIKSKVVDYLGLISNTKLVYKNGKLDIKYIFKDTPKYVILSTIDNGNGELTGRLITDQTILNYQFFKENYKLLKRFEIPKNRGFLNQIYYKYSPVKMIYFEVYSYRYNN